MPWFVAFLLTITRGSTSSSAPSVEPSSSTSRSYGRSVGCRASVRRIFSPSLYAKVATRMRAFTLGPSHLDGCALPPDRRIDRRHRPRDAATEAAIGQRRPRGADCLDELQALVLERFARLHLGTDDVAVA